MADQESQDGFFDRPISRKKFIYTIGAGIISAGCGKRLFNYDPNFRIELAPIKAEYGIDEEINLDYSVKIDRGLAGDFFYHALIRKSPGDNPVWEHKRAHPHYDINQWHVCRVPASNLGKGRYTFVARADGSVNDVGRSATYAGLWEIK